MEKYVLIIFIPILSFFFNSLRAQVPAIEWQKCLGGSSNEAAFSVQQTNDGNFIVAGYSDSNNGDVTGNHGSDDYWIGKLDTSSNLLWQKSLGGIVLTKQIQSNKLLMVGSLLPDFPTLMMVMFQAIMALMISGLLN